MLHYTLSRSPVTSTKICLTELNGVNLPTSFYIDDNRTFLQLYLIHSKGSLFINQNSENEDEYLFALKQSAGQGPHNHSPSAS